MSYFHILPSNAAPNYFPDNHAASFSTPVPNAYNLEGNWEVALMNVTHSNCLDTFNHETFTVEERNLPSDRFKDLKQPYKIRLTPPDKEDRKTVIAHFLKQANSFLKGYVKFFVKYNRIHYRIAERGLIYILSPDLRHTVSLYHTVICHYDNFPDAYDEIKPRIKIRKDEDWSITVVPIHYKEKKFLLKFPTEEIDVFELRDRFNAQVPKEIGYITLNDTISTAHVRINKVAYDGKLILPSIYFHKAITHRQCGIYRPGYLQYQRNYLDDWYFHEWSVSILDVGLATDELLKLETPISMGVRQFQKVKEVCDHLNERVNDERIVFTCTEKNELSLTLTDKNLKVTFDDDLRDILGFDQNAFSKPGTYKASTTIAMNRHIDYFYIYSNIGDNVRVGDIEAPLLAVIPFNPKSCQFVTEKAFKVPMYVPVLHKNISQIDIGIYDGAGKLIPFHEGAVTSVRLHFRRK